MVALELPPFRTAVWNLYGPTDISKSRPALKEIEEWGCDLVIACEARGKDRDELFRSEGWRTVAHDQVRIAWRPERFRLTKEWGTRLSEQNYFKRDGKTPVWSFGQFGQFVDLATGEHELDLEVCSYHTPAHIQWPLEERPARRYKAFIESLLFMAERANLKETTGWLGGGDDNWDEDGAKDDGGGVQTEDTTTIMLGQATGLRQVQAGEPTFGPREIDDYRILQLKRGGHIRPTGEVEVIDGRGAETPRHQIHMREWEWHAVRAIQPPPPAPEPVQHPCPSCGKLHIGVVKV